mgnify:CR=1 FL=1|tara:strand:+ start:403 stop:777 length:375 start_codon:yes stop_codon:yes gene_type:complete
MTHRDNLSHFSIESLNMIRYQERKRGHTSGRGNNKKVDQFFSDRVEKLKKLYEECVPETRRKWVLPAGETDGRKAIVEEEIIGEDISPFDLPDFEEQMPKMEDYFTEDEVRSELIRLGIDQDNL